MMDNISYKIILFVAVLGSDKVKEPSRILLSALRAGKRKPADTWKGRSPCGQVHILKLQLRNQVCKEQTGGTEAVSLCKAKDGGMKI